MIKLCSDREAIIRLWQESFGDREEEITFFLDNVQYADCLAYYENGEVCAMLFLVDCYLYLYEAKYIYAACTGKKHRGRGMMSKLLDYCREHYDILCLIPAEDSLADFYRLRGFTGSIELEYLAFDESDEIAEDYLLEGYHLTDPKVQYFNGVNNNHGMFVFS